jgi:hypothetical protein
MAAVVTNMGQVWEKSHTLWEVTFYLSTFDKEINTGKGFHFFSLTGWKFDFETTVIHT